MTSDHPKTTSAPTPVEALVQRQVDAYNARDLDAFVATYAEDVALAIFPNELFLTGKADLITRYRGRFADNPDLHAQIHQRVVFDNTVIDLETASGAVFGAHTCLAIYEVVDGLIARVTFKHPV